MKECEEENEVLTPLVKMLKYQEYCKLILKKDVRDSHLLLYKNGLCWCHEGLVEKFPSIVVELCFNAVIEVDIASHTLIRVNGEEVSGIEHKRVLDLNDDGERWEGDILQNKPFGWGVLYDSENRRAYEGFRIEDMNVCYGTKYYSDVQKVEYEGEWFEGKRWGRGVQYDRNGDVIIDGEWVNDDYRIEKQMVISSGFFSLHNHIEELIVTNDCCNERERNALDLSFMSSLRVLEVGDRCFESVRRMRLIGLSQLERVVIGKDSFSKRIEDDCYPNCYFYVKNCKRLRELRIGCESFNEYTVCEIDNLPSLEMIEMGELNERSFNFNHSSLELRSDSERVK